MYLQGEKIIGACNLMYKDKRRDESKRARNGLVTRSEGRKKNQESK